MELQQVKIHFLCLGVEWAAWRISHCLRKKKKSTLLQDLRAEASGEVQSHRVDLTQAVMMCEYGQLDGSHITKETSLGRHSKGLSLLG